MICGIIAILFYFLITLKMSAQGRALALALALDERKAEARREDGPAGGFSINFSSFFVVVQHLNM